MVPKNLRTIGRGFQIKTHHLNYLCPHSLAKPGPRLPVMAFTTTSETCGISSFTGTQSICGVTQCKALKKIQGEEKQNEKKVFTSLLCHLYTASLPLKNPRQHTGSLRMCVHPFKPRPNLDPLRFNMVAVSGAFRPDPKPNHTHHKLWEN